MSSEKDSTEIPRWRLLLAAALIHIAFGPAAAYAQTVMVRNAPPGGKLELVLDSTTVAEGTADAGGEATLALHLGANAGKTEIDANVYVDVCSDDLRRIVVVERGQPAGPQPAGCERRDTGAVFLVRRISTLIVDVGGTIPTVVLRQGPVRLGPPRIRRPPRGLVLFGGAGTSTTRDFELMACGNVVECGGDMSGVAYTGGATIWIARYLGVEGSYIRPMEARASGSESTFTFDSEFEAHVVTITGKAGIPIGPVRIFGQGGTNYHRATLSTTQTTGDLSQTFELRTSGWGWIFGGGLEVWVAPAFGIYAELGRSALKGTARDGGEGSLDDRQTYFFAGARIRIAGR